MSAIGGLGDERPFLEHLAASDPATEHIVIQDPARFHLRPERHKLPARIQVLPGHPIARNLTRWKR